MAFKRLKNTTVLFKIETTQGVDAAPVGIDALRVENVKVSYQPNTIQTSELTGSIDNSAPIIGGTKAQIQLDLYLKGCAAPGTQAPEWGDLLRVCGFSETLTAAAIGAPTALTAGTTTSGTLGAPFTAADQVYRGMPLLFTGTVPSGFAQSAILDWILSTKVATLTDTATGVFTTAALAQIPANALYLPGSTSIPSGTLYIYADGVLRKFFGCAGSWKIDATSGGPAKMSITLLGMVGGETDASPPTPTYDTTAKPIWRNTGSGLAGGPGAFTLNKVVAALKSFSVDSGIKMVNADDPNAAESFDPAIITERNITVSIDPYESAIATLDLLTALRNQTTFPMHARFGLAAGNRLGITVFNSQITKADPADNAGLNTRAVTATALGNDAATVAICVY